MTDASPEKEGGAPRLDTIKMQDSAQVSIKSKKDGQVVAVLVDRDNYARETINLEVLKDFASVIDEYAYPISRYRNILDNADYQRIYGIGDRDVLKVDEEGKEYKQRVITGVCQECRIVLPWEYLTVDHQRPQKGGEYEAILKTFRTLGLTMGGPKGHKGKFIQAILENRYKHFAEAPLESESRDLRYKLNDKGIIFYTLIRRQRHQFALYKACMHGLLNMKPLCSICNSRRGNQGIKF
jgi:5-methylcytosine-specific restriction endonuclease McrA